MTSYARRRSRMFCSRVIRVVLRVRPCLRSMCCRRHNNEILTAKRGQNWTVWNNRIYIILFIITTTKINNCTLSSHCSRPPPVVRWERPFNNHSSIVYFVYSVQQRNVIYSRKLARCTKRRSQIHCASSSYTIILGKTSQSTCLHRIYSTYISY